MVTFSQLHGVDLSSLDAVASDFENLVRKWDLATSLNSQVIGPLQSTGWTGAAADAAASVLTDARTQIDRAFDEASAIARALRDAHDQFSAAQKALQSVLDDAAHQNLGVDGDGSVHWSTAAAQAEQQNPGAAKALQNSANQIQQRITEVIQQATTADEAAASALSGDTGSTTTAFNATPMGGIPEAEARQAAQLLGLGDKMTDAQVGKLKQLLSANSSDPRFATAFYDSTGPEGFLKSLGALDQGSYNLGGSRASDLTDLQADLGKTLATATDSKSEPHLSDDWEAGLRAAGAHQYGLTATTPTGGRPYGYQILSNVLRTGNYDPHFLDPIAEHVTQLSEQDPGRWANAMYMNGRIHLDGLGSGSGGYNPMSGVLAALGHSPDAALQYFQGPATLYNTDGTVKAANQANHYLDRLTDPESGSTLQDMQQDRNDAGTKAAGPEVTELGQALQTATTGVPYDATGAPLVSHTAPMSALMSQVVDRFGSANGPNLLHGDGAVFANMNDSLGNMTAAYIGDVQKAVSPGSVSPMPSFGSPASLHYGSTAKLLATLGKDPGAYGSVIQAQDAYTRAQVQDVMLHQADHRDLTAAVQNAVQPGGVVEGILTGGRLDDIYHHQQASDAAYNAKIDEKASWGTKIWDLTGGKAVGRIPAAGNFLNVRADGAIQKYADQFKVNTSNVASDKALGVLQGSSGEAARNAVAITAGPYPSQVDVNDLADSAARAFEQGFDHGTGTIDARGIDGGVFTGSAG
ncbi:hypothetical protein [Kitasatospora sp. LaBMicrA B282]|uniref:hypothetical protein n=1 Tax=Kitasatospora sp. LaBMicrA B282 TaxID=3420949 RepID=UPI003D0E10A5